MYPLQKSEATRNVTKSKGIFRQPRQYDCVQSTTKIVSTKMGNSSLPKCNSRLLKTLNGEDKDLPKSAPSLKPKFSSSFSSIKNKRSGIKFHPALSTVPSTRDLDRRGSTPISFRVGMKNLAEKLRTTHNRKRSPKKPKIEREPITTKDYIHLADITVNGQIPSKAQLVEKVMDAGYKFNPTESIVQNLKAQVLKSELGSIYPKEETPQRSKSAQPSLGTVADSPKRCQSPLPGKLNPLSKSVQAQIQPRVKHTSIQHRPIVRNAATQHRILIKKPPNPNDAQSTTEKLSKDEILKLLKTTYKNADVGISVHAKHNVLSTAASGPLKEFWLAPPIIGTKGDGKMQHENASRFQLSKTPQKFQLETTKKRQTYKVFLKSTDALVTNNPRKFKSDKKRKKDEKKKKR